jgi:hypothetical protein
MECSNRVTAGRRGFHAGLFYFRQSLAIYVEKMSDTFEVSDIWYLQAGLDIHLDSFTPWLL